jgi:hypothetical protein
VIEVVEALDQEVVGFVHVFVQPGASIQKMPGESTFFGDVLFREEVGWLFAVGCHEEKISRW